MLAATAPPTISELLREQRYRRHFLPVDRRRAATGFLLISLSFYATARNDVLLLRRSALLTVALGVKLAHLIALVAGVVWLYRATWPRQHDRALILLCLATGLAIGAAILTRLATPEVQGPMYASCAVMALLYFSQRGLIWPRTVVGILLTGALLVLLWGPRSSATSIGQFTGSLALIGFSCIGIYSMRSFEAERRIRFDAERHERCMRLKLAAKMRELAAAKERAEAMSRARTAFLAAMSHEFRTPMNAIIGLTELLLGTPQASETAEHLGTIRDSARALLRLLNNILDLAKIDAGRLDLSPGVFDLYALLESVVALMRPGAEARSLRLACAPLPEELPRWLVGDEVRLRQVLVNLLGNAIKFTSEGTVTLRVVASSAAAKGYDPPAYTLSFHVEDKGMGIAPEAIARLFQPFEQVGGQISRRYGGTGLGLAISRQIVQAMGGEIEVRSQLERGSTFSFTITLPAGVAADAAADRSPKPMPLSLGRERPLTILIVDDLPVNVRVASAMLARMGYAADSAADGEEALWATLSKTYDVVLMDLHMPGMSGLETSRRIREQLGEEQAPRMIAMTASVFETDRQACQQAGMRGFIGKPLEATELHAVLSEVAAERAAKPPDDRALRPSDQSYAQAPRHDASALPDPSVAATMHELHQPLAASLLDAETAMTLLAGPVPDVAGAREVLGDLAANCDRAGQLLRRLRTQFGAGPRTAYVCST